MASITIRKLDESLKKDLRRQAAEHGRSVEAEVREILRAAVKKTPKNRETGADLFDRIHHRFMTYGGVELQLPARRGRKAPELE
jgi:plasmid stability protein